METKKDTSTKSSEKMTKVQKVIVILTAVVLSFILIVIAATRYMGSSTTYPIDTAPGITATDETTDNSENDTVHSGGTDTDGDTSEDTGKQDGGKTEDGEQNITDDKQDDDGGQTDDKDQSDDKDNSTDQGDGSRDESSGDGDTSNGDKDQNTEDEDADKDDASDKEEDPDGGADEGGDNNSDDSNTSAGGISDGDSVTITAIGESTVTVTIGGETIVIPVQTTIFNGRITKSGVISDSLCGYSIGASVMLYYPEDGSLDGVTLTGAYVKVDSTRLTVSGDYNGDGSKIVFRINGVRLP